MSPRRTGLSKSRITLFEQCPKRLWLSVHRPELAEETVAVTTGFHVGHEVGALASALLPGGHMVEAEDGLGAAVDETDILLASGWDRPIFEATFVHEDVLVRVDLLIPSGQGWHIAEVKSTTGVKDYHLADLATQLWVMRGNHVPIASAAIRHLDRSFVLTESGGYQGLFAETSVVGLVEPIIAERGRVVAEARATLVGDEPVREPGAHCDQPFACSFKNWCGRNAPPPPEWPTSLLPDAAGKKVAREWAGQGVDDLTLVPAGAMPSERLRRIHEATLTGIAWHDADAIRAETSGWAWPRIYLDFETIQFAIPRWLGTRPFEQVPIQFSAHVEQADGTLEHYEWLSIDGQDPRRRKLRSSDVDIGISIARSKLLAILGSPGDEEDDARIVLQVPARLMRCGVEMRMVIDASDPAAPAMVDPALVKLIVRAEQAHRTLVEGGLSIARLERNELARYARLHTLAPDIVSAIVEGRQPRTLSARKLLRTPELPMDWREQRTVLGFS